MIQDEIIREVVISTDTSVVVELYSADQTPTADGFDPADALKRYSLISGGNEDSLEVLGGLSYTRLVKSIGRIRRTITAEINSVSVDFSNLSREISEFEFSEGLEGLIMVIRLLSRSVSTDYTETLILFVGRCEKPTTGTRENLPVTAKHVLGTVDAEIPRRKFSYEDFEGRTPQDPFFEGFRFMPQYGTTAYSAREKRGGLLGFLGFKKTVTKTLQWSSFSDLDAERFLSVAFGRVQIAGTHVAYADTGNRIYTSTAFLEGPIENYVNYRTDDPRFTIVGTVHKRFGYPANEGPADNPGGIYTQQPIPSVQWVGNGFYSRTAMIFAEIAGTNIQTVDPAPTIIVVALAKVLTVPDSSGDWTQTKWSDNAAAITRFIFTSEDYYKLDENWINDESFFEAHEFNNEIVFDASYSDILFVPQTAQFSDEAGEKSRLWLSTGICNASYFKYLNDDNTASQAFLKSPYVSEYDTQIPIEPPDPDDYPGGGTVANLNFFLRRRYTCNVVLTEQMKLIDFLEKVIFVSSRHYLTQGANGKIKLNNKKPVDWGLGTSALSGATIALDDIKPWITNKTGFVLIDPHTANSEVRTVTDANYSTAQNSVVLTASADISVTGFSGCDGADTPATATITVTKITAAEVCFFELDGIEISFLPASADTEITAAGFIYGAINAHPVLKRKFVATWTPGTDEVTVKGKFGSLVLDSALEMTHSAPLADPTAAPVLTATSGGDLAAGDYVAAYSYKNSRGQTLLSPTASVTLTANQKIAVSAITPPVGATVNWFVVPAADSAKLRFLIENSGASFEINSLPRLSAPIIPDINRTAAEVMRVAAVFSDREETRSAIERSNVLKATYKWRLGNREKSINRIDLKFRDASQDFRLVELRLRDDAHIAKTKKISPETVNGQAIDNYHQAYRITAGMLAELRDADFFYEWSSDREALLLEEGDVVCITDDGSQIYNLPVRIEGIDFNADKGFIKASFTARKYSTTLYDDSVAERIIPVILEANQGVDFV